MGRQTDVHGRELPALTLPGASKSHRVFAQLDLLHRRANAVSCATAEALIFGLIQLQGKIGFTLSELNSSSEWYGNDHI